MDPNSFHFLKPPSMAASLSLLLLILILLSTCSWFIFSSASLTLLSFALTASFRFIFSKLKQKLKPDKESSQQTKENDVKITTFETVLSHEMNVSDQNSMLDSGRSVSEDSNLLTSSQSCENSISDDENLIEIDLPEGRYIGSEKTSSEFDPELLDYLPNSMFLQHGLMELLLEINEEDSMIEIDVAMGSIKCPSFEIKACSS